MNKLIKKFFDFALGNVIALILGLASTFLIARLFDANIRGKFDMFITYASLIVLITNMGIDQAYIRCFNDETEENRGLLFKKAIKIPLILNTIVSVFILCFYKNISKYIVHEVSFVSIIVFVIYIYSSIIWNFILVDFRMKQKAKKYSFIMVLSKILYLIFIALTYLILKNNYITMLLSITISNIISICISIMIERKYFSIEGNKSILNVKDKDLIKYGFPFMFSMSITWIFQYIDRISIVYFTDFKEVGLYGGAMSIIAILNTLQAIFTTFWIPVAYERYNNNPKDIQFFKDINEIVSFFMLIASICIISTKEILIFILGNNYEGAQYIFPFLVLMPIMYTISETTMLGINFKKKTKYHIYIALNSAIFNIIGNLILVPRFGAKGAAISTGLAYIVFFVSRSYYGSKFYNIKANYFKFFIGVICVYILATISTFYKFNNMILIISLISILIIFLLYKNTIEKLLKLLKNNIFK